jgi:hypothetical protein
MLAQITSVRNPFNGSGIGGGLGSLLPMTRCSIYWLLRSSSLWRILNVRSEETIVLCFSKRPLRVKWKAVYEMESIKSSIRFFKDLGESGYSPSPSPPSFSFLSPPSYGLLYLGYSPSFFSSAGLSPPYSTFYYPSTFLVAFLGPVLFLASGIIAFPSASISNILALSSIPSVILSIALLMTSINDSKEYL